jgi:multidrug efflux pump subunit AcrA (membrane-fusion protein)
MADMRTSADAIAQGLVDLCASVPPAAVFHRRLVRAAVDATGAIAGGLWLVRDNGLILVEETEEGGGAPSNIRITAEQQQAALKAAQQQARPILLEEPPPPFDPLRPERPDCRVLTFVPVSAPDGVVGVMQLVLPPMAGAAAARASRLAEAMAGYYSLYVAHHLLDAQKGQREGLDRVSKAILQLQHYAFSPQFSEVAANSVLEVARLDRAVLLTEQDGELDLAAVSSVAQVNRKGAWARLACELGEQVLRRGSPLMYVAEHTSLDSIEDEELRQKVSSYCLMTEVRSLLVYPLKGEEEGMGVLILESFSDPPVSQLEVALCTVYAAHVGSGLANYRLFRRAPLGRFYARRLDRERRMLGRRPVRIAKIARWGMLLAGAVFLIWLVAFHPVREKVKAECFVSPSETRVVTAALAGEVETVNFVEGQHVEAGDLLIKLRTDDIQIELNREAESAESTRARIVQLRGEAEQAPAGVQTGRILAEIRALGHTLEAREEQIKLLRSRLEDCHLRSPITGSVVEPEHPEELVGVAVRAGEPLCTVGAVAGKVRIRVAVPGEDVGRVAEGQEVEIRLRPLVNREPLYGRIEGVAERSVNYKNANVFMADVLLDNEQLQIPGEGPPQYLLKPGMTGKARILRGQEATYLRIYSGAVHRKLKYWLF